MKTLLVLLLVCMVISSVNALEFSYREGTGGDYSDTQITYIIDDTAHPTNQDTNYGSDPYLHTFHHLDAARDQYRRTLIRFTHIFGDDWGQIPYGSQIHSAELSIRSWKWSTADLSTLVPNNYVYAINDEWVAGQPAENWEDTVTWNNFSHSFETSFTNFDPYPSDADSIITVNIQTVMDRWVDPDNPNHLENYGLMIGATVQAAMGASYYSDDYTVLSYQPELTVLFTAPAWTDIQNAGSAAYFNQDWSELDVDAIYELFARSDDSSVEIDGETWYYLTGFDYAHGGHMAGDFWQDSRGKFIYLSESKGGITTFDGVVAIPKPLTIMLIGIALPFVAMRKR